jgi:hypothetical protein
MGSIKVYKYGLWIHFIPGIVSESRLFFEIRIPGRDLEFSKIVNTEDIFVQKIISI